jgi:ferrochelatase
LDDPRVISAPTLLRKLLLWGIILPFRPYKVKEAYESIWDGEKGSPLIFHSQAFVEKLSAELGPNDTVALGMRHGAPHWESALERLLASKPDEIVIFSQFPQYASATTGSLLEAIMKKLSREIALPSIRFINDYYEHPAFIDAWAEQIKPYLHSDTTLLLSYHGLPVRDVVAVDGKDFPCDHESPCPAIGSQNRYCYRAQCYATSRALIQALGVDSSSVHTSFQSRLGRIPWIKPYTDEWLEKMANDGIKKIVVACPAFTADCLETLEEVGLGLKAQWEKRAGASFTLVPCLNDATVWVKAAAQIIEANTA